MNTAGLDAQIFVLEPYQRRDGLYVNRRQILSISYIKEQNGKHKPLYTLVQQAETYLNLMPFASIFELEACLAKFDVYINFQDLLPKPPKLEQEPMAVDNYMIEAADECSIISTPKKYKSIRRSRPGCDQKAGSSARKVRDSRKSEWLKNWIVQPRQRKNGKFDKYYYHKELSIMSRSLVGVENFELHGILPKRGWKGKNDNLGDEESPELRQTSSKKKRTAESENFDGYAKQGNGIDLCSSPFEAESRYAVEKFLKESYENLLNMFNDNSAPACQENNKWRIEESSEEADADSPY